MFLIETCNFYDTYYSNPLTSDTGDWTSSTTGITVSYTSNGMYVKGNGRGSDHFLALDTVLPSDYELSCKITVVSSDWAGLMCEGIYVESLNDRSHSNIGDVADGGLNTTNYTPKMGLNDIAKFRVTNGNVQVYVNNNLADTRPINTNHHGFKVKLYGNRNITIKDLKIIEL